MSIKHKKIFEGAFVERPNRFIAKVIIGGIEHTVHVKNTGRCRELLVPGCTVYLEESDNPQRKTRYDLVSVEKVRDDGSTLLINMDSQIPNAVAAEWLPRSGLFSANAVVRREVTYGDSRFDLYVEQGERKAFVEVKGVTLECDGVAMFPDAPTERGAKHLRGLERALSDGYEAYVLFVIQMKGVHLFCPNVQTDPRFTEALREAVCHGVRVIAVDSVVTPDSITADKQIPIKL